MEDAIKCEKVWPGINPTATLTHFDAQERQIIERLSKDWYVTNSGGELWLSPTSKYRYALIKPIDIFQEMFNIDREMVLLFSPYANLALLMQYRKQHHNTKPFASNVYAVSS